MIQEVSATRGARGEHSSATQGALTCWIIVMAAPPPLPDTTPPTLAAPVPAPTAAVAAAAADAASEMPSAVLTT
eukprot:2729246-Rhodomonas_salina.1